MRRRTKQKMSKKATNKKEKVNINFLFASPDLWRRAKQAAEADRRSLTGWINELLIRELMGGKNNGK